MEIKIIYHNPSLIPLEKTEKGDWIDLRAAGTYHLKAGEFALIDLGVSMKLPFGYEAHVVPRSSTFKNYGVIQTNSMAIIDNSYSGTNDVWKWPVYATRDCVINLNDRVCQFRICQSMPFVDFDNVNTLDSEDRNGFGSSGIQ